MIFLLSFFLGFVTAKVIERFKKKKIVPDRTVEINGWELLFCIEGDIARVHKRKGNKTTHNIVDPIPASLIEANIEGVKKLAAEQKIKNDWIFCKLYESGILRMSK